MSTAFIFPGQGAQAVGMGASAYAGSGAARAVFDEAAAALGIPLSRLILEGPADELVRSQNAQPAILCVSIAMLRAAEEQLGTAMPQPTFVAGHSVGEYSALVAAGALTLAEGLRLVRSRGELMQAACEAEPSGMAALIGLTLEPALRACEGTGAQVANVNSAQQIVIGGPNRRTGTGNRERDGAWGASGDSSGRGRGLSHGSDATGASRYDGGSRCSGHRATVRHRRREYDR